MRANYLRFSVAVAVLVISGCAASPGKHTNHIQIDDKVITSSIHKRHAESTVLKQSHIIVETLYGVVLLTGETQTYQQKMTAQRLAEQVEGVKAVHNQIRTDSETAQSDVLPPDIDERNTAAGAQVLTGIEL